MVLAVVLGWIRIHGQILNSIVSLRTGNSDGWVIDSDASNPAPAWNRDGITTEIVVRSINSGGAAANSVYTMVFRLLDELGAVHPVFQADGTTNEAYTHFILQNSFQVPARGQLSRTNTAFIRPAAWIDPLKRYRVEGRVFRAGVVNPDDTSLSAFRRLYHFTGTSPSDPRLNAIVVANSLIVSRRGALATDPLKAGFEATLNYTVRRYDAYTGSHLPADPIPIRIEYELQESGTGVVIPLVHGVTNISPEVPRHEPSVVGQPVEPVSSPRIQTLTLIPGDGIQLDCVNKTYRVIARISHQEVPGLNLFRASNEEQTGAERLIHLNGRLYFGAIETQINDLNNSPGVIQVVPNLHVRTGIQIGPGGGEVTNQPQWKFGGGFPFNVRLLPNGDAHFDGTFIPIGGAVSPVVWQNVPISHSNLQLNQNGLVATVTARLPTGFGYRLASQTNTHVLRNRLSFPNTPISASCVPMSDTLTFEPPGGLHAAEETQPLWFPAASIVWRVNQGRFEVTQTTGTPVHVRGDEYDRISKFALSVSDPDAAVKRSNDRYFNSIESATTPVIEADANNISRLTTVLTFATGTFRAHFPWNVRIQWAGDGQNNVLNGLATGPDELSDAQPITVEYSRGCLLGDCAGDAHAAEITMEPTNSILRFTYEGGLAAVGPTAKTERLQMGYIPTLDQYTHESFTYTQAGFHMPGRILRGGSSGLPQPQRAGALLYSGVPAHNPRLPLTTEMRDLDGSFRETLYRSGKADYAGLNFGLVADGDASGRSVMGGKATSNYPLRKNSKYYLRYAGVSGIHEAQPGAFPPDFEIYGYDFELTRFAFNLLDNELNDSAVDGSIYFPHPSDFTQAFSGLRFDCLGSLTGVDTLEGSKTNPLSYWNGSFSPRSLNFTRNADQQCDPSQGRLIMAVETRVANLVEPLSGTLGFLPDGNLISASDGLDGVNSRLPLPTLVHIPGPTNETYAVTTVAAAYFNDYRQRPELPADEPGWVNVAGKIDVSFFADLEAHIQTSANASQPLAFLDMKGGWSSDADQSHGWTEAGNQHYFNDALFDLSNRGYPPGNSIDSYRNPNSSDAYRVRAKRTWANIHTFEFPLNWFRAGRHFRSPGPVKREMIVLSTERQVERISPKHTELTFGAQFEFLPQANLANIAAQIADHTGISQALTDAIGITSRDQIVGGYARMDELLNSTMEGFYNELFKAAIDPAIQTFYSDLSDLSQGFNANNPLAWKANLASYAATNLGPTIEREMNSLGTDLNKGIIHKLGEYVEQGRDGVGSAAKIISKVSDKRTNIVKVVRKIVDFVAPEHSSGMLPERIDDFLRKSEPTFQLLEDGCLQLSNVLDQIQLHMMDVGTLQNPGGIGIEIRDVMVGGTNQIKSLAASVTGSLRSYLEGVADSGESPLVAISEDDLKLRIRREIMERWLATPVATEVRQVLKERLYENDAAAREVLDSIFSEMNRVIRGIIKLSASAAADNFTEMLDDVGGNVLTADVDGYAHINGDSLKELRLDTNFRMNVFKQLGFTGYLRIRELDSEGTATCNEDMAGATEVVLGAKDVSIDWIKSGLKASVEHKFTFGGANGVVVRGLAGSFQLTGEMKLEEVTMKSLSGAAAFGRDENYLSGGAGFTVSGWTVAGGIFAGKTCTLQPIEIWDPLAADTLGTPPFTGLYYYGEGWVPLNELIAIKSSCFLKLAGGMGIGRGAFLQGPTVIAKLKYGLSGEFLCIVHLKGELTGIASMKLFNPFEGSGDGDYANALLDKIRDGLSLTAVGKFTGSLGPCPLCLDYTKQIGASYKGGKWRLIK